MNPIPYSPRMDDWVALVLFVSFFLSSFVLSRNRKFLYSLLKAFVLHRERGSLFDTSTSSEVRYVFLLIMQTCVLSGVFIYTYFIDAEPTLVYHVHHLKVLGVYSLIVLGYILSKWVLYGLLGWTFFRKNTVSLWLESYSTILYYTGFILFPIILISVYFKIDTPTILNMGLIVLVLIKILILYKWFKLFYENLSDCLLLILYFCALEIVPCFLVYHGIVLVNAYLLLN